MTTCVIVDDEKLARTIIKEYLVEFPQIELIGECASGRQAVELINRLKPVIIFLDVQMPGVNGLEVLENLDYCPFVIFCTAYDSYAIKAFEQNALDYLLKPLYKERFQVAVNRALKRIEEGKEQWEELQKSWKAIQLPPQFATYLFVQKSGNLVSLAVQDIIHLEAMDDYTLLTTLTDQYVSTTNLGKLEEKLNPQFFLRIHRSTIINLALLQRIEKQSPGSMLVWMANGRSFPVGRTYQQAIRSKII